MSDFKFEPYLKDGHLAASDAPWKKLPPKDLKNLRDPKTYRVHDELLYAVNVALTLSKPLLLTGDPGTGKTEFARYVTHQLGLDPSLMLKFETKSSTEWKDVFYQFDSLGRFGAEGEDKKPENTRNFVGYNALGLAFLYSNAKDDIAHLVPDGYEHKGPTRSVVLIDEIDKAPRDVPNDLLNEIDDLYFRIPELKDNPTVSSSREVAPVILFTSNSEKSLPPAFLRRCIFYDIPFPSDTELKEIVCVRLEDFQPTSTLLNDALAVFRVFRNDKAGFDYKPGTAELLDWLVQLDRLGFGTEDTLSRSATWHQGCVNSLIKDRDTSSRAIRHLKDWDWGKPDGGIF